MNVYELFEGYDPKHECKTPDAIYSTTFTDNVVKVSVRLPKNVKLPEDENELTDIEAELHYAVEKVLAPLFR